MVFDVNYRICKTYIQTQENIESVKTKPFYSNEVELNNILDLTKPRPNIGEYICLDQYFRYLLYVAEEKKVDFLNFKKEHAAGAICRHSRMKVFERFLKNLLKTSLALSAKYHFYDLDF